MVEDCICSSKSQANAARPVSGSGGGDGGKSGESVGTGGERLGGVGEFILTGVRVGRRGTGAVAGG